MTYRITVKINGITFHVEGQNKMIVRSRAKSMIDSFMKEKCKMSELKIVTPEKDEKPVSKKHGRNYSHQPSWTSLG